MRDKQTHHQVQQHIRNTTTGVVLPLWNSAGGGQTHHQVQQHIRNTTTGVALPLWSSAGEGHTNTPPGATTHQKQVLSYLCGSAQVRDKQTHHQVQQRIRNTTGVVSPLWSSAGEGQTHTPPGTTTHQKQVLSYLCGTAQLGEEGGVVVDNHAARAGQSLHLVHHQVTSLVLAVIGHHKPLCHTHAKVAPLVLTVVNHHKPLWHTHTHTHTHR